MRMEALFPRLTKGGKLVTTLYPESRMFTATQQPQHVPSVHSLLSGDLYVVFEGKNPDTGRPIIKAHLNPLVWWISTFLCSATPGPCQAERTWKVSARAASFRAGVRPPIWER